MKKINLRYLAICFIILLLDVILPVTFNIINLSYYLTIILPIIWTSILVLTYFFISKSSRVKKRDKVQITKNVFILTLIYLIIYYLLGLFFGFLKTPYSHSLFSIIKNVWSILYILIIQEYIRALLLKDSKSNLYFAIISLLFILINIQFNELLSSFSSFENIFKYICSTVLPLTVNSFLCSYLAKKASCLPSILYLAIPKLFLILFPIVPNIDWFFTSIISILEAFLVYIVINFYILNEDRFSKQKLKKSTPQKTLPLLLVIIMFICFVAGIFKYMPVAVLSNSMSPTFSRGDIVIVMKLNEEEINNLQVGDIIEYNYNQKLILHRINDISEKNNLIFTTKGDNNTTPDPYTINSNQIIGKILFSIPKIGYPTVLITEFLK